MCLVGAVAQNRVIFFQIVGVSDLHPACNSAQNSRAFVFREIVAGAHAQVRKNAAQQFLVKFADIENRCAFLYPDQFDEALGEIARRQNKIRNADSDRAAWHRSIFRFVWILDEDDAAGFLDRADTERAVRSGAAEDHGEAVAELFGKRTEKQIDRRAAAARLVEFARGNLVIDHLQLPIRRNDIDVVGFEMLSRRDFDHRHVGARSDDVNEFATVLRDRDARRRQTPRQYRSAVQ